MKKNLATLLTLTALSAATVQAQSEPPKLSYSHDAVVTLGNSGAVFVPGSKFRYLDAANTRTLLKAWGNPDDTDVIGAIMPKDVSPFSKNGWAAMVYYDADGYVSDENAAKIDYNTLLKQMQDSTKANNQARKEQGYDTGELVGWADAPKHDSVNHKTTWGQDLVFSSDPTQHVLNYSIRVLGRKGVLNVKVVAGMEQLAEVKATAPEILKTLSFAKGNAYTDYVPSSDKKANYNLEGMIAGGGLLAAAAKTGLLAKIIALLVAAKKFIFIGLLALASAVRGIFKKREA